MIKGIKILSLNIRSLVPKYEQITCILEKYSIDFLCITETWLTGNTHDNQIKPINFNTSRQDRLARKRGGGLCIFANSRFNCRCEKYQHLVINNTNLELQLLEILLPCSKPLILINLYRPPSGNILEALELIQNSLNELDQNSEVFILGDFNLDYKINTPSHKKLSVFEARNCLTQYIKCNTRITNNSSTLVDHIYSNSNKIASSGVIDFNISDHFITFIIRKKPTIKHPTTTFSCRATKYFDRDIFFEILRNHNWLDLYNETDTQKCWNIIYDFILKTLDNMCPFKTFTEVPARSDWMTPDIFERLQNRDHKYKIARRSNDKKDWENAKKLKNEINEDCKYAKGDYIQTKLNENKLNPRKFWEILTPLVNPGKVKEKQDLSLRDPDTNCLLEKGETPDHLNAYFTNIGENLAKLITPPSPDETANLVSSEADIIRPNPNLLFKFRPIHISEVELIVKNIETHKSSGIPQISTYFLKLAFKAIIPELTHLLNTSLITGIIPPQWKASKVTPLFKEGNKEHMNNYRPISTIPLIAKILEKAVNRQISNYLELNNLLYNNQFGFRPNRSTSHAIATLLDYFYNAIDDNKFIRTVYI